MGSAIASHLAGAGYQVMVWNRTPKPAPVVSAAWLSVAASPAAALERADVVVISVVDNHAARSVLHSASAATRGALVVNLSSDTPAAARELADWAGEAGIRYLGGTMLTPSSVVGQPSSTMMVAGPEAWFSEAAGPLAAIAPHLIRVGHQPAVVAAYDLALLDAFWTTVAGWSHALALGRAHGLRAADLTDRLAASVTLAASVGEGLSREADAGRYPGQVSTIASARSSLRHIAQASRDGGLDPGLPIVIEALLDAAVEAGHASDGPSRLVAMIGPTTPR